MPTNRNQQIKLNARNFLQEIVNAWWSHISDLKLSLYKRLYKHTQSFVVLFLG